MQMHRLHFITPMPFVCFIYIYLLFEYSTSRLMDEVKTLDVPTKKTLNYKQLDKRAVSSQLHSNVVKKVSPYP